MKLLSAGPESCEELLAGMVACNTVNPRFGGPAGGARNLGVQLEAWAGAWGLECRWYPVGAGEANLLLFCEPARDLPWLLFDSHLDTVGIEGMTVEPFVLTRRGDRLYGRGACDTKGSGAAMLWALREYARSEIRPHAVGVLFTVDEEAGMTGARGFAGQHLAEFQPRLRGVVVGEPTSMRPVVATNGVVRWRTITRGIAAHSSEPTRGRSAISAMVRVVQMLEEKYVPAVVRRHPLTGPAVASVNVIVGGTQVNVIPDFCAIECDRRLVPGETSEAALTERDRALADGPAVEHDSIYTVPPLTEESTRVFHAWARPALAATGCDAAGTGAAYVTNASIYATSGAPVLVLGPGEASQAHTRDEWISRDQLHLAVRTYRSLMGVDAVHCI